MSKPFDATTKYLIENRPRDLLTYAGLPDAEVEVLDADLSTVTADADKILRVLTPEPFLAHAETQSGPDATLEDRTLRYNVLTGFQHKLPVLSLVILLRPEADYPHLTGNLEKHLPDGRVYLTFSYIVVRSWEKPIEEVLRGGLGTLPFAPLSDVTPNDLPDVIARMKERIAAEATHEEAGLLWTATNVLMGLRYSAQLAEQLLKGVRDMEESVTYQAIMRKGEVKGEMKGRQEGAIEEARRMLLRFGTGRMGEPDAPTRARIDALATRDEIEALADRLLQVENWSELFTA